LGVVRAAIGSIGGKSELRSEWGAALDADVFELIGALAIRHRTSQGAAFLPGRRARSPSRLDAEGCAACDALGDHQPTRSLALAELSARRE
jgi:hypothetical protein